MPILFRFPSRTITNLPSGSSSGVGCRPVIRLTQIRPPNQDVDGRTTSVRHRATSCLSNPIEKWIGRRHAPNNPSTSRRHNAVVGWRKSRTVRYRGLLSGVQAKLTVHLTPGEPQRSAEGETCGR